jgi:hypothetical protein
MLTVFIVASPYHAIFILYRNVVKKKERNMVSLKRFYYSLAAGLAMLSRNKTITDKLQDEGVANRVSREVLYYKTHFFNL